MICQITSDLCLSIFPVILFHLTLKINIVGPLFLNYLETFSFIICYTLNIQINYARGTVVG
jgi:hypothetical protein